LSTIIRNSRARSRAKATSRGSQPIEIRWTGPVGRSLGALGGNVVSMGRMATGEAWGDNGTQTIFGSPEC
jgi:hypothetical protein